MLLLAIGLFSHRLELTRPVQLMCTLLECGGEKKDSGPLLRHGPHCFNPTLLCLFLFFGSKLRESRDPTAGRDNGIIRNNPWFLINCYLSFSGNFIIVFCWTLYLASEHLLRPSNVRINCITMSGCLQPTESGCLCKLMNIMCDKMWKVSWEK